MEKVYSNLEYMHFSKYVVCDFTYLVILESLAADAIHM
jgi:hypothetical protein